jgi:putative inorganic carbon (hco3(-)) transporter
MRDILLILLVSGGSFVALFRPVFGMLLFVFLGIINPHSMTWGIAQTIPFSQIAGSCTLLGFVLSSESKRFPPQREVSLIFALWAVFGITTAFAIHSADAIPKLILVSKILIVVILSTIIINSKERVYLLLKVIALSIGFFAAKGGIFSVLSGGSEIVYGPEHSFLAANNSIGLAMAMNVPLLVYLAKVERRSSLRRVMWAMTLLSYPAIVCTYSRGAWIGLAVATLLVFLKYKHKFVTVAAGALVVAILAPFLSQMTPSRLVQRYETLVNYEEDASAESRFWNWEFCRRVGMAHPMSGGGFDYYSKDLYATYYPEFSERWPGKFWSCHSMWFTVFGEHGFPGFVLWLGMLISSLLSLRWIRNYARAEQELSWMYDFAGAVQAAIVTFMVVGTFLDTAYFDMYYFLVAVVIILKDVVRKYSQNALVFERISGAPAAVALHHR